MIKNSLAISSLIRESIIRNDIPGASFSFLSEDEVSEHYLGYQGENEDKIPLRSGMLYDLASLTKVVATTTRIFQLLSEKQIKLSDPIGKFIPDVIFPRLTIEELLMHDSGLPADIRNNRALDQSELVEAIKHARLINPAGQTVVYSDLGYILLGWVIGKVDGDLATSVQKNVFEPLEMTQTSYRPKISKKLFVPTEYQADRGGMIRGAVHDHKAYVFNGVSGHAGLFSSLGDLDKFVSMYLHEGSCNNKQVLAPEVFDWLKQHYQSGRTLGWRQWTDDSTKYWHTGFTGTSIAFDLEQKTGFVCLTNRVYPDRKNTQWLQTRPLALGLFYDELESLK